MFAVISAIYNLMGDSGKVADHCPEMHVNKIFKVHNLPLHLPYFPAYSARVIYTKKI
jgi:hypothetical protein